MPEETLDADRIIDGASCPWPPSKALVEHLNRPARTFDPRDAEVDEAASVRWYVVSIFTREAEAELAKRRFGIFVPAIEEMNIVRGRKVSRHIPVVAGYVFVLLWETDANWLRVAGTPGVDKILGWVPDTDIDKLRWQESCEQIDADARRAAAERVIRAARKRTGASRRKRGKLKRRGKTVRST